MAVFLPDSNQKKDMEDLARRLWHLRAECYDLAHALEGKGKKGMVRLLLNETDLECIGRFGEIKVEGEKLVIILEREPPKDEDVEEGGRDA